MKAFLTVLALISCCGALLLAGSVSAAPLPGHPTVSAGKAPASLPELQTVSSPKPSTPAPGTNDPFLGKGDLRTKAVPVCCCSFGFCEETPNAPCTGGPGACRCNQTGNLCVHI